jgi:hypothetical protein
MERGRGAVEGNRPAIHLQPPTATAAAVRGPRATTPIGGVMVAARMFFFALTGDSLWRAPLAMGLADLGVGVTFGGPSGLITGSLLSRDLQRDEHLPGQPLPGLLHRQRLYHNAASRLRRQRHTSRRDL